MSLVINTGHSFNLCSAVSSGALTHTHIPVHNLSIPTLIFLLQSSRKSELSLQKNKKYGGRMLVGDQVALAFLNLVF